MNVKTEELASLYVLDKLSEYERRTFEDRLEDDAELVLLVRELETALEEQIMALSQHEVSDGVYADIEARIKSEAPIRIEKPVITLSLSTFVGWGMAAALFLGIGVTLFFTSRNSVSDPGINQPVVLILGMNNGSTTLKSVPSVLAVDEHENFVQLAQMAENYWENPDQLPSSVDESPLANTRGSGYAVYDPQSKHGFIAIQNLPTQDNDKNYFLWLKNSTSNVLECAGIIPITESTDGLYFFELDDDSPISSSLVAFYITEEDSSEPQLTQPKGEMVLGSDHI